MVAAAFDIELLLDTHKKGSIVPDMRYYGLGTFPQKEKFRSEIRRRM